MVKKKFFPLISLGLFLSSSFSFGIWFKKQQLAIASVEILNHYPLTGFLVAAIQSVLFLSIFWFSLILFCQFLDGNNKNLHLNIFYSSLPFFVFLLSWIDLKLSTQVLFFLTFCGVLIFYKLKNSPFWKSIKEPISVLILYLILFFVVLKSHSPFYHHTFFDTWGSNFFFANLEHQWDNAKAYDFLGNFTQNRLLGGVSQSTMVISELSAFIILLFDIPLVDTLGKYASIKFMFFGFYIFGTFGCYLFLRYGLKLSNLPSIIGGLGYFWGNLPFLAFMIGEFPIHTAQFIFFPWVLLFIKLAYSHEKLLLSCLAGLIASLPEYAMSSHPESDLIYFIFCNLYNLYLALTRVIKEKFSAKEANKFLGWVIVFPVFHLLGLAYRIIPFASALLEKEYALFDSSSGIGLWWPGGFQRLLMVLFRFQHEGGLPLGPGEATVGTPVFFFMGQPLIFFTFSFVCLTLISLYRTATKRPNEYLKYACFGTSLFFTIMYLFLSLSLPLGQSPHSWIDSFMKWTGFIRVHNLFRVTTYYFFFGLIVAMFGLNFLLNIKKVNTLNRLFLCFLILLGVGYMASSYSVPIGSYKEPSIVNPLFDALLLLGLYLLLRIHILSYRIQPAFSLRSFDILSKQNIISIFIITLTFISFLFLNDMIRYRLLHPNNYTLRYYKLYTPMRVAATHLKNHQHDDASITFLEKEIKQFLSDFYQNFYYPFDFFSLSGSIASRIFGDNSIWGPERLRTSKVSLEDHQRVSKILKKYVGIELPPTTRTDSMKTDLKNFALETLKTENVASAVWKPKNWIYLINRQIGLPFKKVWQYKDIPLLSKNFTILQRRFDQNLKNLLAIDLVFGPEIPDTLLNGLDVKNRIKANLRVTSSSGKEFFIKIDNLYENSIIDSIIFFSTPKEKVMRIYVSKILRMIDTYDFHLKEIFIFLPGHSKDIIRNRPLKRIDFQGIKTLSSPKVSAKMPSFILRKLLKPSWERIKKPVEFYNAIAPERDNFYLSDTTGTQIFFNTHPAYSGPLQYAHNNTIQYYFEDGYQRYLFSTDSNRVDVTSPIGKKAGITTGMYCVGPGFPSIDISFHLRSLFHNSLEIFKKTNRDYNGSGLDLNQILSNKSSKKLLNILGIDFLLFTKGYLNSLPFPEEKMEQIHSIGLTPFYLPESFKLPLKYPEEYSSHVFKNSESYGTAYVAKWVKTIKPNENFFNKDILELGFSWPRSPILLEHFEQHISNIPEIQGATLIESNDPEDFQTNPREYKANNNIEVVKIISSKAVFDVDCKNEHCWFIYNNASLKGWKAYSSSKQLLIHKANLGFIGVKLDRGKHFVWMEFSPLHTIIGMVMTCGSWVLVLGLYLRNVLYKKVQ